MFIFELFMTQKYKGYLLAIASVFCAAAAPVFVKIVIDASNIETTGFFWFLSALFWSSLVLFYKKRYQLIVPTVKKFPMTWLILVILFLASYVLWLYSVKKIGPVNTDFVTLIGFLYMVFLGTIFLKERFRAMEYIGALLAIAGLLVITLNPTENLGWKIIFILSSTIIWNSSRFIIKTKIQQIEPIIFVFIRNISMVVLLGLYIVLFGEFINIGGMVLLVAFLIPLFSTVLQHLTMFQAYKYADFSKLAIVTTLSPFVVILYSYFVWDYIPHGYQWLGGGLVVLGVILLKIRRKKI